MDFIRKSSENVMFHIEQVIVIWLYNVKEILTWIIGRHGAMYMPPLDHIHSKREEWNSSGLFILFHL